MAEKNPMLKQSMGFLSPNKNMNDFANIFTLDFSIFRYEHEERIYPNWMVRYFEALTLEEQRKYFKEFRTVEAKLVKPDYFIEQLKWILNAETIELEYDFYVQIMFDPDVDIEDLFHDGCFERLVETHNERFEKEYQETFSSFEEGRETSQDFSTDTLPF